MGDCVIRNASLEDVPTITALGAQFHHYSGFIEPYDAGTVSCVVSGLIEADHGFVAVGVTDGRVVGMIAGMAHPCWFNAAVRVCGELFWWCEPEARGTGMPQSLMNAMRDWAKAVGCKTFTMGAIDNDRADVMARMYRAAGFRPKERTFEMEIA